MKEINFFLSVICRVIFNDKKYKDIKGLTNDDLLCIQMLAQQKDKQENDIMKEQFLMNQKEGLSEQIINIKKKQTGDFDSQDIEKEVAKVPNVEKTMPPSLYSECILSI